MNHEEATVVVATVVGRDLPVRVVNHARNWLEMGDLLNRCHQLGPTAMAIAAYLQEQTRAHAGGNLDLMGMAISLGCHSRKQPFRSEKNAVHRGLSRLMMFGGLNAVFYENETVFELCLEGVEERTDLLAAKVDSWRMMEAKS